MNTKLVLVGLMGMVTFALPHGVRGQDWTYGSPYSSPYWGYVGPPTYCSEPVPYFSLHPPVYYSYRVARTYGYSPFPYPPGVLTPGSEPPRAAVVQNIYAASEGGESPELQQGRQPLRIDNPFVEQPSRPGVTKDQRKPAGRQPQVVYPAAMTRRAN
jgi:hypothetical protein